MARGNRSFAWDAFDPEAYLSHYYREPHADDDQVVALTAAAIAGCAPPTGGLDVVDVGTGPNLFPLLAALPSASRVTAWEFSRANVEWLREALQRNSLAPEWLHFWSIVRQIRAPQVLPPDPLEALRAKVQVEQGSIFDLPARRFDAATMFFCAESITADPAEFKVACSRFAGCVRSGGLMLGAFLAGSEGYDVAGRRYPAVALTQSNIAAVFAGLADKVKVEAIGDRNAEIRSGYAGMVFLTARAR